MNCRYCDRPIPPGEEVLTYTYWSHCPALCHAACKVEGLKREAYECQVIDADCNDCRHFQRGEVIKRWLSCMENNLPSTRLVNLGLITGHCLKFNQPTSAQPNKWSGLPCFEHRRSP